MATTNAPTPMRKACAARLGSSPVMERPAPTPVPNTATARPRKLTAVMTPREAAVPARSAEPSAGFPPVPNPPILSPPAAKAMYDGRTVKAHGEKNDAVPAATAVTARP
ncbi:MAG: hypothetical protein IIC95_05895 [Chloroflexi bacterium]|nr:hypothetical protein [Chloroflexota bacterium]